MNKQRLYDKLSAIYQALNELSVTGTKNCSIVGAIASTMEEIAKELHDEIEAEKKEEINKQNK